jgi:Raf kinase inhibitor-like YbhB/YbcL family protein
MYLTVTQPGPDKGPNQIHAGENLNPVKTLRLRYDAWKAQAATATSRKGRGAAQNAPAPVAAATPTPVAANTPGVQLMTLKTPAWTDGGVIPIKYSQAGDDVSPPLTWDNVPDGVTSFVLIARDVDAVAPGGTDDLLQWMVWNIPPAARELPEHVTTGMAVADGSRQISATGPEYRGPGALASGPAHHYAFELYALDTTVNVPPTASPLEARAAVMQAMQGHIRGKGVLWGLFKRPE